MLLREMWSETFTLALDNGYTEELYPDELRAWFKERGADMDGVEKLLDQAWNFQRAEGIITNYKQPKTKRLPYEPDL